MEWERRQLREHWQQSVEGEPFSFHQKVQVPCYVQGWELQAIFLEVNVTVVLPSFLAELVPLVVPWVEAAADPKKADKGGAKRPASKKEAKAPAAKGGDQVVDEQLPPDEGKHGVLQHDYCDPKVYLSQTVVQLQVWFASA